MTKGLIMNSARYMTGVSANDTLPSNTNMLFGLQDVRGYDTIILREYVDYLESIEPQRGIPYSKIAKLFEQRSLQSPLLHASPRATAA